MMISPFPCSLLRDLAGCWNAAEMQNCLYEGPQAWQRGRAEKVGQEPLKSIISGKLVEADGVVLQGRWKLHIHHYLLAIPVREVQETRLADMAGTSSP